MTGGGGRRGRRRGNVQTEARAERLPGKGSKTLTLGSVSEATPSALRAFDDENIPFV